jgi:hypothetical protein
MVEVMNVIETDKRLADVRALKEWASAKSA